MRKLKVMFAVLVEIDDNTMRGEEWYGRLGDGRQASGYKSPDGKVLFFRLGTSEAGMVTISHAGAAFGWSKGDDVPDWASGATSEVEVIKEGS